MVLSSSSFLPDVDEDGLSSAIFPSSIVVTILLSAVASSLITYFATYFLCIKGNWCKFSNEVNGHMKKETTQPTTALYEEVDLADQTHRIVHDSINTTSNVAYGQI